MGSDRAVAYHKLFGDLGVGQSLSDVAQHLYFSPRAKNDGAKGLLVGAQSPVQQSQDAIAFPILGKDTRRSHCA